LKFSSGIWGSDAKNIWAVGESGLILPWNGTTWSFQNSGSDYNLFGVFGTDAKNVWAVGDVGTICKWNGTNWTMQDGGGVSSGSLNGVWASDASHVWAVGGTDYGLGTLLEWQL
jgi:hypothetical protein